MVKKYKKAKKGKSNSLGSTFSEEIVNKINKYAELTAIDKTTLIENILNDYLKDKILDNDVITLDEPYFFNIEELKLNKYVKATPNKPFKDLEETYVLLRIPNNLDVFNKEFNSYCSDNKNTLHKGYIYYMNLDKDLVFSYDSNSNEIEIAVSSDRDIYFTTGQQKEKEKVEKSYKKGYDSYLDTEVISSSSYIYDYLMPYSTYKVIWLDRENYLNKDVAILEKVRKLQQEYIDAMDKTENAEERKLLTDKYLDDITFKFPDDWI